MIYRLRDKTAQEPLKFSSFFAHLVRRTLSLAGPSGRAV